VRRLRDFREIVIVDAEYRRVAGKIEVHCICAKEVLSGRQYRVWRDELERLKEPPYAHGWDTLFVSYNAPAELSCYLNLGWSMPPHILDLLIEHRQLVNGKVDKHEKRGLLQALRYHGLPAMEETEKKRWQDLAMRGGPFTAEERDGLLQYCMEDCNAEHSLLGEMASRLPANLELCLVRGRYTVAVVAMEARGIPANQKAWERILDNRERIKAGVAEWMNRVYPLYDGVEFKHNAFEAWLREQGLLESWPRTERTGRPVTDRGVFQKFAAHYPQIERLRQVRAVIAQLNEPSFEITNSRNFYEILPFKAESSRNSTKGCLFQAPRWVRGLIQPPDPDTVFLYGDFEQEEFFVSAVLAGDAEALRLYETGDAYIAFGVQAGFIPPGATKKTHPQEREQAKTLALATQYGMTEYGLAERTGWTRDQAREMLAAHRRRFKRLWEWSDNAVSMARWRGWIETVHGWRLHVKEETKERELRNFKIQGTGADILRLANLLLWENGLEVCCPVHDAFLVESGCADLEDRMRELRRCMERASEYILGGHRLSVEIKPLRYPDRLLDDRGQVMWNLVQAMISRLSVAA
jgi:DNA polymerase I-like protein with 3'-5' exonuclease and polymerase domains